MARLAVLLLTAVALPLAGLLAPGERLVGWSGVGRGEFESWAWLEWWIPRLGSMRGDWLGIPRDLDIGNCLDVVAIALPCKALLGPVAGHDLRVAVVLLLNALAALVAARSAGAGGWVAVAAAAGIALNPVTLWDVAESRFGPALLAPGLLYLAGLARLWQGFGWTWVGLAGTALALTGLTYWYAAYFLAPLGVLAVLLMRSDRLRAASHLALALLLVTPFLLPFLAGDRPVGVPWGVPFPSLDMLAVPPPGVLGPPGPGLIVAQSVDLARPLAPPLGPSLSWLWVALGLAGLWLWEARSAGTAGGRSTPPGRGLPLDRRFALALAAACLLWWTLSLGPWLRWDGVTYGFPLPYQWAYPVVPFLPRLSWPARMLAWLQVGLVLLAIPILRTRAALLAVGAVAALLPAAMAGLLPLPTEPLRISAFYRQAVDGGVIEASFPRGTSVSGWLQSWHGQPVLGSQSHFPGRFNARTDTPNALLEVLDAARVATAPLPSATWTPADLARLRADGFRWVIVHRSYGGTPLPNAVPLSTALHQGFARPPDYQDDLIEAWRL